MIIDANVFVAISLVKDPHHATAKKHFSLLLAEGKRFITNNYIVQESLTVASLRSKSLKPAQFLNQRIFDKKTGIEITRIPFVWEVDITNLFLNQKKYRSNILSFVDCSLIVQARKQNISTLFSFDHAFQQFAREFRLIR